MGGKIDDSMNIRGQGLGKKAAFICLIVAIGGAAYALYAFSVFRATEAMLAAAILFVAASQIPGWLGGSERKLRNPGELADLIKANSALSKKIQVLHRRLDELAEDSNPDSAEEYERVVLKVGAMEQKFQEMERRVAEMPARKPAIANLVGAQREVSSGPPSKFPMTATPALVEDALGRGALGFFLQPVVTIATRRTAAYEATLQLIGPNGTPFDERSVKEVIRRENLEIHLDRLLLDKTVRVATHFRNRGRNASVICRFNERSYFDEDFLNYLSDVLSSRRDLAEAVFPAISQNDLAVVSTAALETLANLNDLGFSFVMDRLRDLDAKPEILRRAGFTMIRAQSYFFSRTDPQRDTECMALLASCRQAGVQAIATDLSIEAEISNLVTGVELGQGELFSTPRRVRAELAEDGTSGIIAQAS